MTTKRQKQEAAEALWEDIYWRHEMGAPIINNIIWHLEQYAANDRRVREKKTNG